MAKQPVSIHVCLFVFVCVYCVCIVCVCVCVYWSLFFCQKFASASTCRFTIVELCVFASLVHNQGQSTSAGSLLALRWCAGEVVWRWALVLGRWRRHRRILVTWRSTVPVSVFRCNTKVNTHVWLEFGRASESLWYINLTCNVCELVEWCLCTYT